MVVDAGTTTGQFFSFYSCVGVATWGSTSGYKQCIFQPVYAKLRGVEPWLVYMVVRKGKKNKPFSLYL